MFSLNRREIMCLVSMMDKSMTAKEMAHRVEISIPSVYRILNGLDGRGFIIMTGVHPKRFTISNSLHSVALRQILASKEYPIESFMDSKMLVLLSICNHGRSIDRISIETGLTRSTLEKYLIELQSVGLASVENDFVVMPISAGRMISLLHDFSRGLFFHYLVLQFNDVELKWVGGLDFIFSVPLGESSKIGITTGIVAMKDYGILLLSNREDRYWSLWDRELRVEDHALFTLLADRSRTAVSYSLLLLQDHEFDRGYLLEEARVLDLEEILNDILDYLKGKEVSDTRFPPRDDFESLCRDYGVALWKG
jgi:hypothetical protein